MSKYGNRFNDAELITMLKAFVDKNSFVPSNSEWDAMRSDTQPSSRTFRDHFGGWMNALKAIGIESPYNNYQKSWAKEDALIAIKKFAGKVGRIPTSRDFIGNPDVPSVQTLLKIFGSYRNGIVEAGLITRQREYSEGEVMAHLQALSKKLGRVPTARDINNGHFGPTTSVLKRLFGNIHFALYKSGVIKTYINYLLIRLIYQTREVVNKIDIWARNKNDNGIA